MTVMSTPRRKAKRSVGGGSQRQQAHHVEPIYSISNHVARGRSRQVGSQLGARVKTAIGVVKTGVANTGVVKAGAANTGVVKAGAVNTGVVKTRAANTGVVKARAANTGAVKMGAANTGMVRAGATNTEVVKAGE